MKFLVLSFCLFVVAVDFGFGLTPNPATGSTPPQIQCPKTFCASKPDGNYAYDNYGVKNSHYFIQCVNKVSFCQPCFPLSLIFKEQCNQCLYSFKDECIESPNYPAAPSYHCPNKCMHRPKGFTGNIKDPYNPFHFVACLDGKLVGCINCPAGLQFNERWNSCLYEGRFKTEAVKSGGNEDDDYV